MAEITAPGLAKLFSSLVNRDVRFVPVASPPESKVRQLYVTYNKLPDKEPIVVKADLPLLSAMAGALVGLPYETALARAEETPMGEIIRDAMQEVLNVASRGLSTDQRVILKSMALDPVYCDSAALRILKDPDFKLEFKVSVANEVSGHFSILTKF